MKMSRLMLAAAAASMTAGPVLAAPTNPAASLSVAKAQRAGSSVSGDSELGTAGGGGGVLALLIAAGVAAIVVIAVVNEGDDDSDSP